jgi:hypothetical protein
MNLLSPSFLARYPDHPAHMTPLGQFTFLRTYARFLPHEGRRETWKETIARAFVRKNTYRGLDRGTARRSACPSRRLTDSGGRGAL